MPEIHSTTKNLFDHEVAERLHRQLPLLHLNRKRAAVLLAECLGLQEGVCAREPDKAEVLHDCLDRLKLVALRAHVANTSLLGRFA